MPSEFTHDVFISYSSKDKVWVRGELIMRIEKAGLKAFIDFRDFRRGGLSIREMERGVKKCRKTLLVLTPDYIKSGWGEMENVMGQTLDPANRSLRMIPLLKADCKKPLRIGALTHIDFTGGADLNLAWSQLLTALGNPLEPEPLKQTQLPKPTRAFRATKTNEGTTACIAVEREIREWLKKRKLVRSVDGNVIELLSSPELKGWRREQVTHSYKGEYVPPPAFEKLMKRFRAPLPINKYFGLRRCSPLPIADDNTSVAFVLVGGTWEHVFALNKIFFRRHSDKRCRVFRDAFEGSWIEYPESAPLEGTPLYHPVVAEVLVITSDNQLVLGRRNSTLWYGDVWSASIEEQMLRGDPDHPKRRDAHLFDAANRGVQEELGATVRHDESRLLSVGITWSNFAACFFFIVRCEEDFEGVIDCWTRVKHDPNENVALDSIDATPGGIQAALTSTRHNPSIRWRQRVAVTEPNAGWHVTAKARLRALLGHLKYLEREGSTG